MGFIEDTQTICFSKMDALHYFEGSKSKYAFLAACCMLLYISFAEWYSTRLYIILFVTDFRLEIQPSFLTILFIKLVTIHPTAPTIASALFLGSSGP